jgi:N-glycosylase/DNA lyase
MANKINVSDFSLADTLECGQVFRWKRDADGVFTSVIGKKIARVRQSNGHLECDFDGNEDFLRKYFALDHSLPAILATFPRDELTQKAVKTHRGLRVIRQEPWECLASFIASSMKQIAHIRQIVEKLSENFGEPLDDSQKFFAFPSVEAIARASETELRACKLGFRARNLRDAARKIADGAVNLEKIRALDYENALAELQKLPGVGEKIANCALLFAYERHEAVPRDVWISRILREFYFARRRKISPKELRAFAKNYFGPYGGWAQQYLFHYVRNHPDSLERGARGGKMFVNHSA